MSEYTKIAVAGYGSTLLFSEQLAELADVVGIPKPSFRGKLLWKEGVIERWIIKTKIPGRINDPEAEEEEAPQAESDVEMTEEEEEEDEEDPEERAIVTPEGELLMIVEDKDDTPARNMRSHAHKVIGVTISQKLFKK